ncbi:MAG TPA: NUDIX domain-containing protein [Ignavibacteria bacterium]
MPEIKSQFIECYAYANTPEGIKFLLLKRHNDNKIHPGIWQIITGRIEEREKAFETAKRELEEETGLKAFKFFVLPKITQFYTFQNDTVNLIPLFLAEVKFDKVLISDEHSEYLWCNLQDATEKVHWNSQKNNLKMISDFLANENLKNTFVEIK